MSSEYQFLLIVCLAILVGGLMMRTLSKLRARRKDKKAIRLISARDAVLTKTESRFYASLTKVVGEKYLILMKVGLPDVFGIKDGSGSQMAYDKISEQKVDFLLCEPDSFEPILGIDIEKDLPKKNGRKRKEDFVKKLYEQSGLDLLRVPVATQYPPKRLRDQIAGILREAGRL